MVIIPVMSVSATRFGGTATGTCVNQPIGRSSLHTFIRVALALQRQLPFDQFDRALLDTSFLSIEASVQRAVELVERQLSLKRERDAYNGG